MTYLHFSLEWTIILIILIVVGAVIALLFPRISNRVGIRLPFYLKTKVHTSESIRTIQEPRRDDILPQGANPVLAYGRTIVRRTRMQQHGGVYRRSTYFVEVTNSIPNTTARNCRGSLTIHGSNIINQRTVWENHQESIDIGHNEYLFLFKVETFRTETGPESTRLYFTRPTAIDPVDEESRDTYDENLDREITVLVQSENGSFPVEENSLTRTIRQIINNSINE